MKLREEKNYRPAASLLTLFGAAAIVTAGAVPAGAQSNVAYSNEPVQVVRHSVNENTTLVSSWGGNYLAVPGASEVSISFVDSRDVPATRVEFAVHEGNATELLVDKGSFSPGKSITHGFAIGSQFSDAAAVEVVAVTFADGTTWERR